QVGDFVLKVDGIQVDTDEQVARAAQLAGSENRALIVTLLRNGVEDTVDLMPKYCYDTKCYRVGMYIRDNTAGVGTLTYYHPQSGSYGALGHMVGTDGGVVAQKGNILGAQIQSIKAGVKGEPGEKIGIFAKTNVEGSIEKNTPLGIFGHLGEPVENSCYPDAVPIAAAAEIAIGPAQIITVLENDKLETFDVEIVRVMPNQQATGKGLILKVVDEQLLERTGGIVQGMSGSPILQNGSLIGAVSHVFVNDPTKGYGCLAEWMIMEGISTNLVK
ncbi:MAG: SpoIVB peptidase, partial [Clostridiales bacterium]